MLVIYSYVEMSLYATDLWNAIIDICILRLEVKIIVTSFNKVYRYERLNNYNHKSLDI